jgi:hypothetical protein
MTKYTFKGSLKTLINKAETGTSKDVDYIMAYLTSEADFALTRYVDFSDIIVKNGW